MNTNTLDMINNSMLINKNQLTEGQLTALDSLNKMHEKWVNIAKQRIPLCTDDTEKDFLIKWVQQIENRRNNRNS